MMNLSEEDEGSVAGQANLMTTMFGGMKAKLLPFVSICCTGNNFWIYLIYTTCHLAQQGFTAAQIGNMLFWVSVLVFTFMGAICR